MKKTKENLEAMKHVEGILKHIGEDTKREGLLETPYRVIKSHLEMFDGYNQSPVKILRKSFTEGSCDEMVILKDIEYASFCEHHMLPFVGHVHIGYLPNGKVVGVSKMARVVDAFAHRLQIQERMTQQIADIMNNVLRPKGVIVIVEGKHQCMTIRGVKKNDSLMITSAIRGTFKEPAVRAEFMSLLGLTKK